MRLAVSLVTFISAATLTTSSLLPGYGFGSSSSQSRLDAKFPVPGDNPLEFCADPTDYILTVDSVDLTPNPPAPGKTLNISAAGTFSKDVEAGAKVFLQVKYGLITLIKQEADLCDQIVNIDLSCPLKKGDMTLQKSVDIPAQVPPGKYSVMAEVKTVDDELVTCMMSEIVFP